MHPRYVVAFREGAGFVLRLTSHSFLGTGATAPGMLHIDGVALIGLPPEHAVPHLASPMPLAVVEEESRQSTQLKDELGRAKWTHAHCNRTTSAFSGGDAETAVSVLVELAPPVAPPPPPPAATKGKKGKTPPPPPPVLKPAPPPRQVRTAGCVLE